MSIQKKQLFLGLLMLSMLLASMGVGSAATFGFKHTGNLHDNSYSDSIWNLGKKGDTYQESFMESFLSYKNYLYNTDSDGYLDLTYDYNGKCTSGCLYEGDTNGIFAAGYLYVTKNLTSVYVYYDSRATQSQTNEYWHSTTSLLVFDIPYNGQISEITSSTTPIITCIPEDDVRDQGGMGSSSSLGGTLYSYDLRECTDFNLGPGLYYIVVGIGGRQADDDRNDNAVYSGGSVTRFNDEAFSTFDDGLNRLSGTGYAITTVPMSTTDVKSYLSSQLNTNEEFCRAAGYSWLYGKPSGEEGSDYCCGNGDLNAVDESTGSTCTSMGWSDLDSECLNLGGDIIPNTDYLNYQPEATNGNDGCCGDDKGCVRNTKHCSDITNLDYCTSGCEVIPSVCSGGIIRCSQFEDEYGECDYFEDLPDYCETVLIYYDPYGNYPDEYACKLKSGHTEIDCGDHSYETCPSECTAEASYCTGAPVDEVCDIKDGEECHLTLCTFTTPPPDMTFLNSDKRFLCLQDATSQSDTATIDYSGTGEWKWWDTWEDYYRIHEYRGRQYLSNGGRWQSCGGGNGEEIPVNKNPNHFDFVRVNVFGFSENSMPDGLLYCTDKAPTDLRERDAPVNGQNYNYYLTRSMGEPTYNDDALSDSEKFAGYCYNPTASTADLNSGDFFTASSQNNCNQIVCNSRGEEQSIVDVQTNFIDAQKVRDLREAPELEYGSCLVELYSFYGNTSICTEGSYCVGEGAQEVAATDTTGTTSTCCANGNCQAETTIRTSVPAVEANDYCSKSLRGEFISTGSIFECVGIKNISLDGGTCCLEGVKLTNDHYANESIKIYDANRFICYNSPFSSIPKFGECCAGMHCYNELAADQQGYVFRLGETTKTIITYGGDSGNVALKAGPLTAGNFDLRTSTAELVTVNYMDEYSFDILYTGAYAPTKICFDIQQSQDYCINLIDDRYNAVTTTINGNEYITPRTLHHIEFINDVYDAEFDRVYLVFEQAFDIKYGDTILYFDNFQIDDPIPYYCTEKGWSTELSKSSCEVHFPWKWIETPGGGECCGDKADETFIGKNIGCFKGTYIKENEIGPYAFGTLEHYPDLLYHDDLFRICGENDYGLTLGSERLNYNLYDVQGNWYCAEENKWRRLNNDLFDGNNIMHNYTHSDNYDVYAPSTNPSSTQYIKYDRLSCGDEAWAYADTNTQVSYQLDLLFETNVETKSLLPRINVGGSPIQSEEIIYSAYGYTANFDALSTQDNNQQVELRISTDEEYILFPKMNGYEGERYSTAEETFTVGETYTYELYDAYHSLDAGNLTFTLLSPQVTSNTVSVGGDYGFSYVPYTGQANQVYTARVCTADGWEDYANVCTAQGGVFLERANLTKAMAMNEFGLMYVQNVSDACCGDDPEDEGQILNGHLCTKDKQNNNIYYDYSEENEWAWWNVEDQFLLIHTLTPQDYISNGQTWFTCNAYTESTGSQVGLFDTFTMPTGFTLPDDLCANVPSEFGPNQGNTKYYNYILLNEDDVWDNEEEKDEVIGNYTEYLLDENSPDFQAVKDGFIGYCTRSYDADGFYEDHGIYEFSKTYDGENGFLSTYCGDLSCNPFTTTQDGGTNEGGEGEGGFLELDLSELEQDILREKEALAAQGEEQEASVPLDDSQTCAAQGGSLFPEEIQEEHYEDYCQGNLFTAEDGECCKGRIMTPEEINPEPIPSNKSFICYESLTKTSSFAECCSGTSCANIHMYDDTYGGMRDNGQTFELGSSLTSLKTLNKDGKNVVGKYVVLPDEETTPPKLFLGQQEHINWSNYDYISFEAYYIGGGNLTTITFIFNDSKEVTIPLYNGFSPQSAVFIPTYIPKQNYQKFFIPMNYGCNESMCDLDVLPSLTKLYKGDRYVKSYYFSFDQNTNTKELYTYLYIDNFELVDEDKENRYCSGAHRTWLDDLQYDEGENRLALSDACNARLGYAWTYNACCGAGLNISLNEEQPSFSGDTYVDIDAGCFGGVKITDNTRLSDAYQNENYHPEVLYKDMAYYVCNKTTLNNYTIADINNTQRTNTVIIAEPFSTVGSWFCDGSGTSSIWRPLDKLKPMQILSAKLYAMRTDNSYDLHCDVFEGLSSLNKQTNVPFKATPAIEHACVLKNYDEEGESESISIGLSLGEQNVNEVLNDTLKANYPFNGTFYGNYTVTCTEGNVEGTTLIQEGTTFFQTCDVDIINPANVVASDVYLNVSYNEALNLVIISMDAPEDKPVLVRIWNSITGFFRNLFTDGNTQETQGLELMPIPYNLASYEHIYLSKRGNLFVVGSMDVSSPMDIIHTRVDYHNFSGDIYPLADAYNLSLRGYGVQVNKSGYIQSINIRTTSQDFDWRYLTSNLRLEDTGEAATDWDFAPQQIATEEDVVTTPDSVEPDDESAPVVQRPEISSSNSDIAFPNANNLICMFRNFDDVERANFTIFVNGDRKETHTNVLSLSDQYPDSSFFQGMFALNFSSENYQSGDEITCEIDVCDSQNICSLEPHSITEIAPSTYPNISSMVTSYDYDAGLPCCEAYVDVADDFSLRIHYEINGVFDTSVMTMYIDGPINFQSCFEISTDEPLILNEGDNITCVYRINYDIFGGYANLLIESKNYTVTYP